MADQANTTRRSLIKALPFGALATFMVGATAVEAVAEASEQTPQPDYTRPFVHTLTEPHTRYPGAKPHQPGDMALILPGVAPWDDTHLMRDGRFAGVGISSVRGMKRICLPGGEQLVVSPEEALTLVAGWVDQWIRRGVMYGHAGYWTGWQA